MEDIIDKGIEKGYIAINEDKSRIQYFTRPQTKSYRYSDPEEKVRAVVFLQLIFDYGYPINRIQLEVQVPRRLLMTGRILLFLMMMNVLVPTSLLNVNIKTSLSRNLCRRLSKALVMQIL